MVSTALRSQLCSLEPHFPTYKRRIPNAPQECFDHVRCYTWVGLRGPGGVVGTQLASDSFLLPFQSLRVTHPRFQPEHDLTLCPGPVIKLPLGSGHPTLYQGLSQPCC